MGVSGTSVGRSIEIPRQPSAPGTLTPCPLSLFLLRRNKARGMPTFDRALAK